MPTTSSMQRHHSEEAPPTSSSVPAVYAARRYDGARAKLQEVHDDSDLKLLQDAQVPVSQFRQACAW